MAEAIVSRIVDDELCTGIMISTVMSTISPLPPSCGQLVDVECNFHNDTLQHFCVSTSLPDAADTWRAGRALVVTMDAAAADSVTTASSQLVRSSSLPMLSMS